MKTAIAAVIFGLCAFAPPTITLADDQAEIAEIREQLRVLASRLAALEARHGTTDVPATQRPAATTGLVERKAAAGWSDRVSLNGDLRYRHEGIDERSQSTRARHRVRARVGLQAQVAANAEVVVRLASGSDDPTSTNQTLDNGATTKNIGLDLAYLSLAPSSGTRLVAGKMKNPLYRPGKTSLLWDSDLSPEGLAWSLRRNGLFLHTTALWVEERGSSSDSLMLGAQAGYTARLAGATKLTAGLGHYDYSATQGRSAFYDGEGRGNTLSTDGRYINDYDLTEVFAELSTTLAELPFSVFANWVNNSAASGLNEGYLVGARLGKASDAGKWEFGYSYRELEADAVIATFTDSDIGGGGTAIRGHSFDIGYAFSRRIGARLTYLVSENGLDTVASRDYDRLQADVSLKY